MKKPRACWPLILSLVMAGAALAPATALSASIPGNRTLPAIFSAAPKGYPGDRGSAAKHFVPGQIVLKYKSPAPEAKLSAGASLRKLKDLGETGAQLVSVADSQLEQTVAELRASGLVEYAAPNYLLQAVPLETSTPLASLSSDIEGLSGGGPGQPSKGNHNDRRWKPSPPKAPGRPGADTLGDRQWALDNTGQPVPDLFSNTLVSGKRGIDINLPDGQKGRGSGKQVLVGLIDTGVDIEHPSLRNSIWVNPRVGQYGYSGDLHGWNFVDSSPVVFDSSNPLADAHGTHIAGVIAAQTRDRFGVAGAAPDARIVVLKFIGADGYGSLSDAILAIDYARQVGVKVINASWGGLFPLAPDGQLDPELQPLADAIQASSILFVTASGNSDGSFPADLDTLPEYGYQFYPAAFDFPNVISVASVNSQGKLSTLATDGFDSCFGANTVALAAPGSNIVSTLTIDPGWGFSVQADVYVQDAVYNARIASWGFGLQDIDGQSTRTELLRRELLFLDQDLVDQKGGQKHGKQKNGRGGRGGPGGDYDVLLVDDDNSEAGYPDTAGYWKDALDELDIRYKLLRVPPSQDAASDGPSLSELEPYSVVIWQTGRDGESGPLLTSQDEYNLSLYVEQGGSLLLSGERAIDENPVWAEQLLQVWGFQLGIPLPFYNLSGIPSSSYDGFNGLADGVDFGSLPVLYDLFVPANPETARLGLTSRYAYSSGTSASAGYVSAVGALLYAKNPRLSAGSARRALVNSVKRLPDLRGKVSSGGMVDAEAALNYVR
jgi:subtilisin family serine protease